MQCMYIIMYAHLLYTCQSIRFVYTMTATHSSSALHCDVTMAKTSPGNRSHYKPMEPGHNRHRSSLTYTTYGRITALHGDEVWAAACSLVPGKLPLISN
jgi:hypothetical protein